MACYVREMDLWRDRKEEGDPGLVKIDCIKILKMKLENMKMK